MPLGEMQRQILSKMSVISSNLRARIVTRAAKEDKEAEIATIAAKMVIFRESVRSLGKRMIGLHDAWTVSNAVKKAIEQESVPTLIQAEIEIMVVSIARAIKTVQIGTGEIGTDLAEMTTTTMGGLVRLGDHQPKMMCR